MTGIDTNIIVRYIVQDDPVQSKLATDYIERNCTKENQGLINQIVLCEIVWVLKRAYKYDKSTIISVLRNIISSVELHVLDRNPAWYALSDYQVGSADFSDYFLSRINKENKVLTTVTFDRTAAKHPDFKLLT